MGSGCNSHTLIVEPQVVIHSSDLQQNTDLQSVDTFYTSAVTARAVFQRLLNAQSFSWEWSLRASSQTSVCVFGFPPVARFMNGRLTALLRNIDEFNIIIIVIIVTVSVIRDPNLHRKSLLTISKIHNNIFSVSSSTVESWTPFVWDSILVTSHFHSNSACMPNNYICPP